MTSTTSLTKQEEQYVGQKEIRIMHTAFQQYFTLNKGWVVYSKILVLIAFILNGISGSLYFFTHDLMLKDLKNTVGTNERDILKVIQINLIHKLQHHNFIIDSVF